MYNKENNLITLLPTYNSTISPLPISWFALCCLLFFLVDQTRYFVLSLGKGFVFGSVRFLVYTPTIQFIPLFVFPFASWVVSFFFDVGMMGVTSRCLASRDNLIKKKRREVYGYFVSVYSVSSGCLHHCVVRIVCMGYAFLAFVTLHAVRNC